MTTTTDRSFKLEHRAKGWCGRFRCGDGPRRRVYIQATDEVQAYARADRVRERIDALVAAGRASAAAAMIDAFNDARTEKQFSAVERAMRDLAHEAMREASLAGTGLRTFDDVLDYWLSGDLRRKYPQACREKGESSTEHARNDYNAVIKPILGHLPIKEITEEIAQQVVAKVSHRRPATRRKYQTIVRQVLDFSVWPLKLITYNPLPRKFVEGAGTPKEGQIIYPDEDSRFLSCSGIDLIERAVVGFQTRNGTRMGETEALTWRQVDFRHGAITLYDNKTGMPRVWAAEPDVLGALRRLREERDHDVEAGDRVFPDCRVESRDFRQHLLKAGVDRHELHHAEGNMRPVTVHATRASFCTVALAVGRPERWVMDRTGHTTSEMLEVYVRKARSVRALQAMRWFDPLDQILWPSNPKEAPGGSAAVARVCAELVQEMGHAVGHLAQIQPILASGSPPPREAPGSSTCSHAQDFSELDAHVHVDVHGGPAPSGEAGSSWGPASWGPADRERLLATLEAATAASQWPIVDRLTRILDGEPLPPPVPRN